MADSLRDTMIIGVRNAHALEAQAATLLEREIDRLGDYPALQARKRQHLEETRRQQDALGRLLTDRGSSPSGLKETALQVWGNVQAMFNASAEDGVLKSTFAGCGFEAYEIASYKALIVMARRCGDGEVERVAQGILREEEAMQAWLGEHLDEIVEQYIEVQGYAAPAGEAQTSGPQGADAEAPAGQAFAGQGYAGQAHAGPGAAKDDPATEPGHADAPTPRL